MRIEPLENERVSNDPALQFKNIHVMSVVSVSALSSYVLTAEQTAALDSGVSAV